MIIDLTFRINLKDKRLLVAYAEQPSGPVALTADDVDVICSLARKWLEHMVDMQDSAKVVLRASNGNDGIIEIPPIAQKTIHNE